MHGRTRRRDVIYQGDVFGHVAGHAEGIANILLTFLMWQHRLTLGIAHLLQRTADRPVETLSETLGNFESLIESSLSLLLWM